jgi:hypothetical protein
VKRISLSPSMGVALLALVLAASGGVYASASGSPSVIVACVHHKGGGLYIAAKCAPRDRHVTLRSATPQSVSGSPSMPLFAQVESSGTINASSPGVTASLRAPNTGTYRVNFGQDVSHCAVTATEGALPVFGLPGASTPRAVGTAIADMFAAGYTFANGYQSADTVQVETFDGTVHENAPFYIVVSC